MRRPERTLGGLLLGGALVCCSLVAPDGSSGARDDLTRARERWAVVGPNAYRVSLTRRCFCSSEGMGPVVITVTSTGVTRVYEESGQPVSAELAPFFPTVAALLVEIEEALDAGAARVEARYDPVTGAPVEVYIDRDEGIADEEVRYLLAPVEPLPL